MALTYTGGVAIDANRILAEATALPNATTGYGAAAKEMSAGDELYLYCQTAITVATGQVLRIALVFHNAAVQASMLNPHETGGVAEADAHYCLVEKTAAEGALTFVAGDLIAVWRRPHDWPRSDYKFVGIKITADADQSAGKIDAFIRAA